MTDRRSFLRQACSLSALGLAMPRTFAATASRNPVALFEKPLQSLEAAELAERLAGLGFHGVEATVRPGGRIAPERTVDDLPAYVEILEKSGLEIPVMATGIGRADDPHAEATLRTAAALGISCYRMAGLRYDLARPILAQLDEFRPQLTDLAALNRELGMTAVYQNHAGAAHVGGPVWDLLHLMKDIDPEAIAIAFDIRHAMVEGTSAWAVNFQLVRSRVRAVYVKDFVFEGARAKNVPLGEGIVGDGFYRTLRDCAYEGPISLHVPHLAPKNRKEALAGLPKVKADLEALRSRLAPG